MASDLESLFERVESELEDVRDIAAYLENDVLETKRIQWLEDDEWQTGNYIFVVQTGGPHIEVTSNYYINIYWGAETYEHVTISARARATIDKLTEYMDGI